MVTSDTSTVVTIDTVSHEPIESTSVGDEILCMDGYYFESGALLSVFGTLKGRIIILIDWDSFPNNFHANGPINCIKITKDGKFMIATTEAGSIYLFTEHNESYFNGPPKE